MDKMVVSFTPDGKVEHLLKDGFFQMPGNRKVERVSTIQHSPEEQRFFIRWLMGPFAADREPLGRGTLTTGMCNVCGVDPIAMGLHIYCADKDIDAGDDRVILFNTYEQAVEVEIAMVNAMRIAGVVFAE